MTLGKPMGSGHPVAAVITRREFLEGFADETVVFSTFGGNPVSAAAGLAVLDVLEDERVLPRVVAAGEALRAAVREGTRPRRASATCAGWDWSTGSRSSPIVTPSFLTPPRPRRSRTPWKRHGVLVGTTAAAVNVIKVRPPLAFTDREVPVFVKALVASLRELDLLG